MKGAWILLAHSLKRARTLILSMGMLLAGFQLLLTLVARSIQRSNAFDQMSALIPDFMRQLMGPSFIGLMSFSGIVCVGYFHIAVMGALVGLAVALATESAAEIETRFMDLILARPLARHWIIGRTIAVLAVSIAFVLGLMMLGTWSGLYWLAPEEVPWPPRRLITSLAVNLGALILCWGGVALAVSSLSRRRSVAGALTGILALALYLLDYIARVWRPAESVAWLSPFRYYNPLNLILGLEVATRHLWVLFGIACAGFALAYLLFSRRDI